MDRIAQAFARAAAQNRAAFVAYLCAGDPDFATSLAACRAVLASGLPPVMVDILQIEQALLNLLRNSIEAIGEAGGIHGTISVEASAAGADFIEIRVSDTGPGFPADRLDSPFLPFSSTKAEGLGFGLPLCKSIIEAHGGEIEVKSTVGEGTTFTVSLPLEQSAAPPVEPPKAVATVRAE